MYSNIIEIILVELNTLYNFKITRDQLRPGGGVWWYGDAPAEVPVNKF